MALLQAVGGIERVSKKRNSAFLIPCTLSGWGQAPSPGQKIGCLPAENQHPKKTALKAAHVFKSGILSIFLIHFLRNKKAD